MSSQQVMNLEPTIDDTGQSEAAAPAVAKFPRSVSMLCWAYQEEELLEGFLDRAFTLMDASVEDFEIVLINDGSTDRTVEIAEAYAAKEPRLRVVHHPKNLNVGEATKTAIAAASKEFFFWQTVDWAYDLKNLRLFLELLDHYDVVQGVRPTPERILSHIPLIRSIYRARHRSDTLRKAVVSLTNYYLLRVLYGVPFHDFQNVTFYPTEMVRSLGELTGSTSFVNPELLIRAHKSGAQFIEVPIRFLPREGGEAKGTKPSFVIRALLDVVGNWARWGWRIRKHRSNDDDAQIHRVEHPVWLSRRVARLIVPLLEEFR